MEEEEIQTQYCACTSNSVLYKVLCACCIWTPCPLCSLVDGFSNGLEHKCSLQLCIIMSEGFYVVVCDREGASDIAAPGLKDYPHMRPAIFPLSVDLFTGSKHNMVARVVSLPGLPELFHHCLSTIASQLGLFVGHTGAVDQPSSPRIPEDTYLGHLFNNKTSTTPTPALPPPVKLLILAPRSQQIPCHLSLQARGKIHKQTLVQETVKFPYSCAFPPPNQKSL